MKFHFGKSRVFLIFCLAFIAGVGVARFFNGLAIIALLLLLSAIVISVWWGKKWYMVIGFAGIFLVLGVVRYQMALPDIDATDFIGQFYEQEVVIEAVVSEDPDRRSEKTNLTIRDIVYGDKKIEGKVLLNVGRQPEYQYGDRLRISGELEEPFETEDFSYKNYLSRFRVYGVMRYPEVEKINENEGNIIKAGLIAVKNEFRNTLSQILPEPHNALVLGLILGLKKAIPENLNEAFIVTGVSHIVVVSGYNISIITRNILRARGAIGVRIAFWLSLVIVLGFVVITGAEASVIRAAVMGMMLVFALNIGRMYQAVNALVFAGAVMILLNPQILVFDIGFQLSFLATLGLIFVAPIFDKLFQKIPNFLEFRTNLSSTLAAQLFTLPLLIFYFERLSIIAPLVNVLILWVIPYAMFFGFFAGLFGIVYLPIGQVLAAPLWVLLEYMITVVEYFSQYTFASLSMSFGVVAMLALYIMIFAWTFVYRYTKGFRYYIEYIEMKL